MKKILLFFLSVLFTATAFAEDVRVYTDYTPVRILYLKESADADLEASKAGLSGGFKTVDKNNIPADRTDRNAWKFIGDKITVDPQLKKGISAKKEARKTALDKLKAVGLTDGDLAALNFKEE